MAAIAADRESGASALVRRALALLRSVRGAEPDEVPSVVVALCRAQPSMGPMWNAAALAWADLADAGTRLDAFAHRLERSEAAIARAAVSLLREADARPLRLVTFSASGAVLATIRALTGHAQHVAVAEGRPALEGRSLARELAGAGVSVSVYSDAGIAAALDHATAVLVGADAVAPAWFINKVGTGALAALAGLRGIPVYVLGGREKFVPPALAETLQLRSGQPAEIWADPLPGITVENPYFERIPLELAAALVTDAGVVAADQAAELCEANARLAGAEAISRLRAAGLERQG
ncbi:MAG TPA: hypothetical protein VIC33_05670 [Vicinamibacterales bacterium]